LADRYTKSAKHKTIGRAALLTFKFNYSIICLILLFFTSLSWKLAAKYAGPKRWPTD